MSKSDSNLQYALIQANIDRRPGTGPVVFNGIGLGNDNDYYFTQDNLAGKITRNFVAVEWVALRETMGNLKWVYVPCGISSGLRPHEIADKINQERHRQDRTDLIPSTYKIDEYIGGQRHKQEVIDPNRRDNMLRARLVQDLFPESAVIAPVIREGAVRQFTQTYAFSRNLRYEEEDYMVLWYPVVDKCRRMVRAGDLDYSRNSIWETMRAILKEAGFMPPGTQPNIDVVGLNKKPQTLLERTRGIADSLKYQIGKGFEPREAATALAQIFTIDGWLRTGYRPPGASPNVHEILRGRPPAELVAMDRLRAEFEPMIKKDLAGFLRSDDLPEDWQVAIEAAKKKPLIVPAMLQAKYKTFADGISARAREICSVTAAEETLIKAAERNSIQQRLYDSADSYFDAKSLAVLFDDNLYAKLPEWEQLALKFAIGGTETAMLPRNHPFATVIFADMKRGRRGFEAAAQNKVADLTELAGTLGRQMKPVIDANKAEVAALEKTLEAATPGLAVVTTLNFLNIADAIERGRKNYDEQDRSSSMIAAPGGNETSSTMRLALMMKYMERSADKAIFQEGWERSNDLVQLRLRARLIQAGLVPRPMGDQVGLPVYTYRTTQAGAPEIAPQPDVLLDDVRLLTAEVKRCAKAGIRAPEQALALARMLALHDMIADSRLSGGLINPMKIDIALKANWGSEMEKLKAEAEPLLLGQAALWMPHERLYRPRTSDETEIQQKGRDIQNRLMDPYIRAQQRLGAQDLRAKVRRQPSEVHVLDAGPSR